MLLAQNTFAQQWITKAPMQTPRAAPGIAVLESRIYVMGGSDGLAALTSAEYYDLNNNTWTSIAPMNNPRVELAAAAVNGKIYAIGGFDGTVGAQNVVEEYNPATNTWITKASMITSRSVLSIGVINNKIYVVGGWPGQYSALEMYDPAIDTWTTKASLPVGSMQKNGGTVIDGNFYLAGGRDYGGTPTDQVFKYNPITDSWSTVTALPQAVFAGSVASLSGRIHHFGGRTGSCQQCLTPEIADHYIYDPATNSWTYGLALTQARGYSVSATINNAVYLIGGVDANGLATTKNEAYTDIVATGIANSNNEAGLIIGQNQYAHTLSLFFTKTAAGSKIIMLMDAAGKVVYHVTTSEENSIISTDNLASGIYVLKVISGNTIVTRKIAIAG